MMRDAILNFPKQFLYDPQVVRAERLKTADKWIVCGMGGSQLAVDLVRAWQPSLHILSHRNYGLPDMPDSELAQHLIIMSSYSGATEEALDSFHAALKKNLPVAAISIGGALETIAQENNVPFVKLPDTGIQPRSSLGFMMRALLALMGRDDGLKETRALANTLTPELQEPQGRGVSEWLCDHVPVVYASPRFAAVAYNWKIKFNETGKIPAFWNIFPELNHNEMTGFDVKKSSRHLSERFAFILLKDEDDHPRMVKRMEVLEQQYRDRDLPVLVVRFAGSTMLEKIFSSLLVADWAAVHTAQRYGLESEHVPMVEEFKRLIAL